MRLAAMKCNIFAYCEYVVAHTFALCDISCMKTVAYTREALAGLRKHRSDAAAIMAKVTRYAETSVGDVKALTGRSGKRLR